MLGKGPKIKKRKSMVFDHNSLTPSPPNLNYGIFTQNFSDLHWKWPNYTIKIGPNKDLVLGDPLSPLDGQRPYFRAF